MWRICILALLSGTLYAQEAERVQPPESEVQEPLNQSSPTVGDPLPEYAVRNLPLVPRGRCSIPLTRIPAPPGTDFLIEQVPPADPNARIQRISPPAPPCPEEAPGLGASQPPASPPFSLGGFMMPRLLTRVELEYSEEAREAGIEGAVILAVIIGTDGTVEVDRVIRGLGFGLDQNAIDAVSQWTFTPTRRNGQLVEVPLNLEVTFSLRDEDEGN